MSTLIAGRTRGIDTRVLAVYSDASVPLSLLATLIIVFKSRGYVMRLVEERIVIPQIFIFQTNKQTKHFTTGSIIVNTDFQVQDQNKQQFVATFW